ncbi:DNA-binding protein [bacterium]|nr:DNA-binding protein [bacterium]
MNYKKLDDSYYLVQLEIGDEVISQLKSFALTHRVKSGFISGIGAIRDLTLGYYDRDKGVYIKKTFPRCYEVCTLSGNITYLGEKEPIIHLHGIFSDQDYSVIGGHLFEGTISAAGEFGVRVFPCMIQRKQTDADLKPIEIK